MIHSSRKAWRTITIPSNDYPHSKEKAIATANKVAHELIKNGKSPTQKNQKLTPLRETDNSIINDPFTLNDPFTQLETGKAVGLDDI